MKCGKNKMKTVLGKKISIHSAYNKNTQIHQKENETR